MNFSHTLYRSMILFFLLAGCVASNRGDFPFEYDEISATSPAMRDTIREEILRKDIFTPVSSSGLTFAGNLDLLRFKHPDFNRFSHYRLLSVETGTEVDYHLVFWLTSDEQILKVESYEGLQGKFTQGAEFLWKRSFLLSPEEVKAYLQLKLGSDTSNLGISRVFIASPSDAYPGPNEIFTWFYKLSLPISTSISGADIREFYVSPYFCPSSAGEAVSEANAYLWYLPKRVYSIDATNHLVPVF